MDYGDLPYFPMQWDEADVVVDIAAPESERRLMCRLYEVIEVSAAEEVVRRSSPETADCWIHTTNPGTHACVAVPRKQMLVSVARQLRTLVGHTVCRAVTGTGDAVAEVTLQGENEVACGEQVVARVHVHATLYHYIAAVELDATAVAAGVCGAAPAVVALLRQRLDPRHAPQCVQEGADENTDLARAGRLPDEDLIPEEERPLFELLRDNGLLPSIFARTQHALHAIKSTSYDVAVYTGPYTDDIREQGPVHHMSFEVVGDEVNGRLPVIPRADYLGVWRAMVWVDAEVVTLLDAPRFCPDALKLALASNDDVPNTTIYSCFEAIRKDKKSYPHVVRGLTQGDPKKDGQHVHHFPPRPLKTGRVWEEHILMQSPPTSSGVRDRERFLQQVSSATGLCYALPLPARRSNATPQSGVELTVLAAAKNLYAGPAHTSEHVARIPLRVQYHVQAPVFFQDTRPPAAPWARVCSLTWIDFYDTTHTSKVEGFMTLMQHELSIDQRRKLEAGGIDLQSAARSESGQRRGEPTENRPTPKAMPTSKKRRKEP